MRLQHLALTLLLGYRSYHNGNNDDNNNDNDN